MTKLRQKLRRHVSFLRGQRGFGLIELLIAMSLLTVGIMSASGLYASSHLVQRRAAQTDTAGVLAQRLLERFRAETWDNIALSSTLVAAADSTYTGDSALGGSTANDITETNGATSATNCAGSNVPVVCNPSRSIPDATTGEVAPDGRSYRLDTYVRWGCPDGSVPAPSCATGDPSFGRVKVVTIVVRDATTSATLAAANPLYRVTTTFDRLSGGSMPLVTVTPTGTTATTTTATTTSATTTAGAGPADPTSVLFTDGGGSGSAYIDLGNVTSLSYDVVLPASSVATNAVHLIVSDGNSSLTQTFQAAATQGAGTVHFTGINGQSFSDGTITVSAYVDNSSGSSSLISITSTKDTVAPVVSLSSPTNGQSVSSGQSVNFAGTPSGNASDSAVTVQVCSGSTVTCSTPTSIAATTSSTSWSGSQSFSSMGTYAARAAQTDAAGNTGYSGTNTFTVTFGVATQIVISGSTSGLASGTTRAITATIQDAAGNTVTSGADSTASITFSKTTGTGTVTGLTTVAASGGVATDTVTGSVGGSITLKAAGTINSTATNSGTLTLTVTFGTATQIVLSGATTSLAGGATRVLTATIKDAAGNTVTSGADSTASITFSKTAGTGTVTGLATVAASGGVATDTVAGGAVGSVTLKAAGTINGGATNSGTLTLTVTFAGIDFTSVTSGGTGFSCTYTTYTAITCSAPSVPSGGTFTGKVRLVDATAGHASVTNTTGSAITVAASAAGNYSTFSPASSTIATNASATTAAFSLKLSNGANKTATVTATITVSGVTYTVTLTAQS